MAARNLTLMLVLVATACGPDPQFVSPAAPLGPPPFIGPPGTGEPAASSAVSGTAPAPPPPGPPAPLTFYKTLDSSDWVAHNFKVQQRYARVIAVYSGDKPPLKVTVAKLDFNVPGSSGAAEELAVTLAVKTLEEAANQARGGDLVAVLPGRYHGFNVGDKVDAGDGRYVHFKALGAPGEVIVDSGSSADPPG